VVIFYAHSLEGELPEKWQPLDVHLREVAELARAFAEPYDAGDWAYCAGLWHDLGKYQREFQDRLRGNAVSVEHSGAGAALADLRDRRNGRILAFAIAGHHSGLANLICGEPGLPSPLQERLKENKELLDDLLRIVPTEIREAAIPPLPPRLQVVSASQHENLRRSTEFWTRFIFSALVDADRLNTEAFASPSRARLRGGFSAIGELRERVDRFIEKKRHGDKAGDARQAVSQVRQSVLEQCRGAAHSEPGAFSLTAPTGSGKTLSAMSFALHHAERWQLRRVIVVIPYTSIIEQNAHEYAEAMGEDNVVEHHSSLDPDKRGRTRGEEWVTREELAAENWDAPVVVTTTVQFFESLFSNRPSRCRKLHNIARSVVILDEVQTLPPGFLLSITECLSELTTNYGCTVVLSTATPPALARRSTFPQGLENVRPIIAASDGMHHQLQRAEYVWPDLEAPACTWPELAAEIARHSQVLTVVHRRKDARLLAQEISKLVPMDSVVHLSALMCPAHRTDVLARVKKKLASGVPCRLISTQLVEAGVDVDFPAVYRCLGGLDSIVQAGGRCNREGRLDMGRVVVFRAPSDPPPGTPRRALEVTESLLREHCGELDLSGIKTFDKYFRMLYAAEVLDRQQIQMQRQEFNFASVGRDFRLIEDGFSTPIVVPYGESSDLIAEIRRDGPTRKNLRAVQRFTVSIYREECSKLTLAGALDEVGECVRILAEPFRHLYDAFFGLAVGESAAPDPAALIG
jgi:CRISPR-associated endonuclease/helicase Cas3